MIIRRLWKITGRHRLLQERLLRKAMREAYISERSILIEINHVDGWSAVNGIKLPIIYPLSFARRARGLWAKERDLKYFFSGNMSAGGGRRALLDPYQNTISLIEESSRGRNPFIKGRFGKAYFSNMGRALYGLCPHQLNFRGNSETMWTYRFIECCLAGAIPVVMSKTPLGDNFISGFRYVLDTEILDETELVDAREKNWKLAVRRHILPIFELATEIL